MWQQLAALVVIPLVTTGLLGAAATRLSLRELVSVDAAAAFLDQSVRLDDLRRAIGQELLPTITAGVLRDPLTARQAGFPDPAAAVKLVTPHQVQEARTRTDEAQRAAQLAGAGQSVGDVGRQLADLRRQIDAGSISIGASASSYLAFTDRVAALEHGAAVKAGASGLSETSAQSINDVSLVVDLCSEASRQLPTLFAATVLGGDAGAQMTREWYASGGTWNRRAADPGALSSAPLRDSWLAAALTGPPAVAAQGLIAREGVIPGAVDAPTSRQVLALGVASATRDARLSALLADAVGTAQAAVTREREAARTRLLTTVSLCLGALVVSGAAAVHLARSLTRSLRQLVVAANTAVQGRLAGPPPTGPREVRTVGAVLNVVSDGLLRVRQQALAVTRGDIQAARAVTALPGQLGEVLHASIESMLHAVETRDALRAELSHRATHDPLTGLWNRAAVLDFLAQACAGWVQAEQGVALLFVDLDGFKSVNDSLGHGAGDELLRALAGRFEVCAGPAAVVGRLGGDEFVVILRPATLPLAAELGHLLVRESSRPVELRSSAEEGEKQYVTVGASVGVAVFDGSQSGGEVMLAQADAAVYRAKAAGRGQVMVYDEVAAEEALRLAREASALRDALAEGTLEHVLLGVEDPSSGVLLARGLRLSWRCAPGEPMDHAGLLLAADHAGVGRDLGLWSLGVAMRAPGAHLTTSFHHAPTAVELSRRHLTDPRVVTDVARALKGAGRPPGCLVVEAPEIALQQAVARRHLAQLVHLGVHVALVDVQHGAVTAGDLAALTPAYLAMDPPSSPVTAEQASTRAVLVAAASASGTAVVERLAAPQTTRSRPADTATGREAPPTGDSPQCSAAPAPAHVPPAPRLAQT